MRTHDSPAAGRAPSLAIEELARLARVGDIVFTRVPAPAFRAISAATACWANHVGVVKAIRNGVPMVAESRFPFSGTTTLARFVARSQARRVALRRLPAPLAPEQERRLRLAADRRAGIFYDTGFGWRSRRQFCSKYVREVMLEATGETLGDVQSFAQLLERNPDADLLFWKLWFFGRIPWERLTVTPASLYASPRLVAVFEGTAAPEAAGRPAAQR
jgi:hypothetical protein